MTPQLPTSNLLVRAISQKFRQLLGQSTDPSNKGKIGDTGDDQNNATMRSSDGASPFLPPPSLDVNPAKFEQGDDFVQGVMDEILTDEAEYDRSFDEYTGTRPTFVDRGDEQSEAASEGINVAAETEQHAEKMLPYSSPCPSYKRQKLQQAKETSNSSESEDDSDQEGVPSSNESRSEEGPENVDGQCDARQAEREQEEYILESLSFAQREELLRFMKQHPFVGKRPIRRTARRQFMRDIRDKATEIGVDQERIALLERHVRKLYLEIHKIDADPEGSEFGPELDDEYVPNGPASTQKRKWDSDKESSSKFRKIKREFSEEVLPARTVPSHDVDRDVDTVSMEDSAISVSEGDAPETNLDHARPDLAQESSFPDRESDSDEVTSKGPGTEDATDTVKSAAELLGHNKFSKITPRSKSTSAPSRSPDDAKKWPSSTSQERSSHMPGSHASSEKIVVVLDSSSSKSSNAPDPDSVSDTTSNTDQKNLQLEKKREKKRMKKRRWRQAKRDQKRRESLTAESTAQNETHPQSQVPSKKTGAKTKKNSVTGHGNTAFDDDYWDLTDF